MHKEDLLFAYPPLPHICFGGFQACSGRHAKASVVQGCQWAWFGHIDMSHYLHPEACILHHFGHLANEEICQCEVEARGQGVRHAQISTKMPPTDTTHKHTTRHAQGLKSVYHQQRMWTKCCVAHYNGASLPTDDLL